MEGEALRDIWKDGRPTVGAHFFLSKVINEDLGIFEIPLRCQRVKTTSNDEETSRLNIDIHTSQKNGESYQFHDDE